MLSSSASPPPALTPTYQITSIQRRPHHVCPPPLQMDLGVSGSGSVALAPHECSTPEHPSMLA